MMRAVVGGRRAGVLLICGLAGAVSARAAVLPPGADRTWTFDEAAERSLIKEKEAIQEAGPQASSQSVTTGAPALDAPMGGGDHGRYYRTKFFGQTEYFLKGNAYDEDEKDFEDDLPAYLLGIGYASASGSAKVSGGFGVRAGVIFIRDEEAPALGLSVGYVSGPTRMGTATWYSPFTGERSLKADAKTDFLRGLMEARKRFPISPSTSVEFKGAAGFASGWIEDDVSYGGSGAPSGFRLSHSWSGLSWEIAPALVFKGTVADWRVGFLYAVFPKMAQNDDFNAFDWKTLGLSAGMEFR